MSFDGLRWEFNLPPYTLRMLLHYCISHITRIISSLLWHYLLFTNPLIKLTHFPGFLGPSVSCIWLSLSSEPLLRSTMLSSEFIEHDVSDSGDSSGSGLAVSSVHALRDLALCYRHTHTHIHTHTYTHTHIHIHTHTPTHTHTYTHTHIHMCTVLLYYMIIMSIHVSQLLT